MYKHDILNEHLTIVSNYTIKKTNININKYKHKMYIYRTYLYLNTLIARLFYYSDASVSRY